MFHLTVSVVLLVTAFLALVLGWSRNETRGLWLAVLLLIVAALVMVLPR